MADVISRAAALGAINDYKNSMMHLKPFEINRIVDIYALIKDAPAADAAPVRHGQWTIKSNNRTDVTFAESIWEPVYTCSACGLSTESYVRFDEPTMPEDADFWHYCPNCGAKMDKDQ